MVNQWFMMACNGTFNGIPYVGNPGSINNYHEGGVVYDTGFTALFTMIIDRYPLVI